MATKKTAVKKKPAAKPVAGKAISITIKLTFKQQQQVDEAYKQMIGAEKKIAAMKAARKAGRAVNNSDLCEQWEIYSGAVRTIISIVPGFNIKIRRFKKGAFLICDLLDSNCSTGLPE